MDNLIEIFRNKHNNLNVRYKYIYSNLSSKDKLYIDNLYPEYTELSDKLKSLIFGKYHRCEICNKIFSWSNKRSCSRECYNKIRENDSIEKYGTKHHFQSDDFKSKREETNIEKYGDVSPINNEAVREKIKRTNIEKYGVDNVLKNLDIREKIKHTNIEKYGVDNVFKNNDIKLKIENTNIEKYGGKRSINDSNVKSRIRSTLLKSKIDYIYDITGIEVSMDEVERLSINHSKDYSKQFLISMINFIRLDEQPDISIISDEYKGTGLYNRARSVGHKLYSKRSFAEAELCEFLEELGINFVHSCRSAIKPYELDIYIPDYKLAIEFNGSFWHSSKYVDKYYHQMKTKMCNEQGITLIHIHEYLYRDNIKKAIYKSIIKSKLKLNKTIFARKCEIKIVCTSEERNFLNTYHLQGYVASKICYGLYIGDELLSICSFGSSRFNKKYEYELLRNCTKSDITVVGGFTKMLSKFKHEFEINHVICYNDASISYNKNNNLTEPNYVWTKENIVYKRYSTMKHKLHKVLGDNYNSNITENENMINNGFNKVYDSGNYISII